MTKYSFQQWLNLKENQHSVEIQVAHFLEDILEKATALKKQDIQAGYPHQTYANYVNQVWPQEARQNGDFILPNSFPAEIAGRRVQFKLKPGDGTADTVHDNGKFEGFVINVHPFDYAKSIEDVDRHLSALKSAMHHEAEHIYNIGAAYDSNDWAGDDKHRMAMQYMSNPGEIRAHARQMAYLYAKHFPGEPFDLQKAQSILNEPGFTTTHKNYFSGFAKPKVWEKNVNKFGYNHANPHDQIMALVPQFLDQYKI